MPATVNSRVGSWGIRLADGTTVWPLSSEVVEEYRAKLGGFHGSYSTGEVGSSWSERLVRRAPLLDERALSVRTREGSKNVASTKRSGQVLLVDPAVGVVVRVAVLGAVAEFGRARVRRVAQVRGHLDESARLHGCRCRAERARHRVALGHEREVSVAWASVSRASGSPTNSTARAAASATSSPRGSASPTSSLAKITRRRAMNRALSPLSSSVTSQ